MPNIKGSKRGPYNKPNKTTPKTYTVYHSTVVQIDRIIELAKNNENFSLPTDRSSVVRIAVYEYYMKLKKLGLV